MLPRTTDTLASTALVAIDPSWSEARAKTMAGGLIEAGRRPAN
jgi:hypothetical protein